MNFMSVDLDETVFKHDYIKACLLLTLQSKGSRILCHSLRTVMGALKFYK